MNAEAIRTMRDIIDQSETLTDWQVGKLTVDLFCNADCMEEVVSGFISFADPALLVMMKDRLDSVV